MDYQVTNVVIAGLGGQGVLKASDILAKVVFQSGFDVKKSEIHGMSQRGGSVSSDIRFGTNVLSPMVPKGGADYLVVLTEDQVEPNKNVIGDKTTVIIPSMINENELPNKRSINVALLGILSTKLTIDQAIWEDAIAKSFPEKLQDANKAAFELGQTIGQKQ